MMLKFVDVSNWQQGMDLAAVVRNGGLAGAIIKATEGVGYVDPSCDGFVRQLREAGALFGYYHFARNNDASAEAEFFRTNTIGYEGGGIPVLDWEDGQSVSWVNEFVGRYHELTGVWPWVYANPWRFNQGTVNTNCGRWVAGYPRDGITDIDYGLNNELPGSYNVGLVCAWQFSSSVRIAGYGGNLDGDVFYGDEEAWMAYAGGGSGARLGFADAAAEVMEHLCTHSAHGYSQPNRAGVGTGGGVSETITLSDGTRVGISGGDRDCSSACIECYAALGVDVGGATYTGNMRSCMTSTGNFRWHPWGTYEAKRGDIYLNESHHTAMCLGGGKLGEFSRSELHSTHGTKGDQDGWESHITSFYTYSKGWDGVLEYVGPEPEEEDTVTDADIERIAQLAADKVVNYDLGGSTLRDRIIETDFAASVAAKEVTRTDDCTGRGNEMTTHDHIKWLAATMQSINGKLAEVIEALDGFVPATSEDGGAADD